MVRSCWFICVTLIQHYNLDTRGMFFILGKIINHGNSDLIMKFVMFGVLDVDLSQLRSCPIFIGLKLRNNFNVRCHARQTVFSLLPTFFELFIQVVLLMQLE